MGFIKLVSEGRPSRLNLAFPFGLACTLALAVQQDLSAADNIRLIAPNSSGPVEVKPLTASPTQSSAQPTTPPVTMPNNTPVTAPATTPNATPVPSSEYIPPEQLTPDAKPADIKPVEVKPVEPEKVSVPRDIRPLPGGLDAVPMFNSNNPEIVLSEGILLSTFPSADGPAHLNVTFDGRFDIFAHHIADGKKSGHLEDLNLGLIVGNVSEKPVKVQVLNAASYCTRPDSPFINVDALVNNDEGKIFAGPGDRVTDVMLREEKPDDSWTTQVTVKPGEKVLLKNLVLNVRDFPTNVNGRSLLAKLKSSGPVRLGLVARFSKVDENGNHISPTDEEFFATLDAGKFVEPRDPAPTRPEDKGAIRYGRVAGVQYGSTWKTKVTDRNSEFLTLPVPEKPISYPISSLAAGTFGTGQVQSAPMVVRNESSAYQAHGNYGVKYDLTFPLKNTTERNLTVNFALETPLKSDEKKDSVTFYQPTDKRVFYRGTLKVGATKGKKVSKFNYQHIVEHRGESVAPVLSTVVPKNSTSTVEVQLIYPPDCTPPQMLTLSTSSDVE